MSEADWGATSGTRDLWAGSPMQDLEPDLQVVGALWEAGGNTREPSLASHRLIQAPDSPHLSIRLPSSPSSGAPSASCSPVRKKLHAVSGPGGGSWAICSSIVSATA